MDEKNQNECGNEEKAGDQSSLSLLEKSINRSMIKKS
jgi:hypothetical protein